MKTIILVLAIALFNPVGYGQTTSSDFYKSGYLKYAAGDVEGSIKDYDKAIELDPNYAEAYFGRGIAKSELVSGTSTFPVFRKIIYSGQVDSMGYILDSIMALEIMRTNYVDTSINGSSFFCGKFVAIAGTFEEGFGMEDDAMLDFNKTIELNPGYKEAYYCRGLLKFKRRDITGAINDFSKAIKIDRDYLEAYDQRGISRMIQQDSKGARKDFKRMIELDPGNVNAYYRLGSVKYEAGDRDGAAEDFSKVVELDPGFMHAYFYRGLIKSESGNETGAIEDFTKVLELDPKNIEGFYERGNSRFNSGDKTGACSDWRKAGELGDSGSEDLISKYCERQDNPRKIE